MGWADEAEEELDDSMLPSYALEEKKKKKSSNEEEKKDVEVEKETGGKEVSSSANDDGKPKSFAALLGGGNVSNHHQKTETDEGEENRDEATTKSNNNNNNNNNNATNSSNNNSNERGGERGDRRKKESGKKQQQQQQQQGSSKQGGGKGNKGGKRGSDPSSNYNQADLHEDERGLHNDVEVRRRQLQKLKVSKSTRAKDLDTLIACVDLAEPGTGEVKRALKESIFKPLAPAYTTLIKWVGKSGNCSKALEVFECMGSVHGVEPNTYTCSALLNALGRHRMGQEAWEVYEMMKEKNIECNIFTYTALITAFQKSREQDRVYQVYDELKESGIQIDSITYAAMLAACEKGETGTGECTEKALRVFADMKKSGVDPNQQCYQSLMTCCEKGGRVDKCFELHGEMVKHKHVVDKNIYQSLIAVCGKKGMWQKAIEVYKSLKTKKEVVQPYTNCQNEVLLACAKSGRGLEALALYEDARKTNKQMSVTPVGLGWVILACERSNMWKKNLELIPKLPSSGLPNKAYMLLIGACTRAGKFTQANELFEKQRQVLTSGMNMNKPTVDLCELWVTAFRCAQSERGDGDTLENSSKAAAAAAEKIVDLGADQVHVGETTSSNGNWFEQKTAKNSVRALWKYAKIVAPKDPLTDQDANIAEVDFVFPPETSICKAAAAAAAKWGDSDLIENIVHLREKSNREPDPMIRGALIASYANRDKREEANDRLKQMKVKRLTPGFATYAALCAAANRAKDTPDVFAICEEFTILYKIQNQAQVRGVPPVAVPKDFCVALKDTSERLKSWLRALEFLEIWNQFPTCGPDAKETYVLALKESGVNEKDIESKIAGGGITGATKNNNGASPSAETTVPAAIVPNNGKTWNTSSPNSGNGNNASSSRGKPVSPPLPPAPMLGGSMPKPNKIPPLPNVVTTPKPSKKLSANVSAFVPNSSSPKVALKADAKPFVFNPPAAQKEVESSNHADDDAEKTKKKKKDDATNTEDDSDDDDANATT